MSPKLSGGKDGLGHLEIEANRNYDMLEMGQYIWYSAR
jgi:hypothetical protein